MLDHISASQLNTFMRCPAQYKFRYIDGLVLPPRSSLTKGKAVHSGQEYNYTQKIETFTDLPLSQVQEVTAAAFEEQAQNTEWDRNEDIGKIKDETISLASLYHQEVAPTVQPVLVEEKVEVELDGFNLLGYIDVLDSNGYIRDTKTASKSPSEDEATKSIQLTAYSLAHRHLMGLPENGVKLDYLVNTKQPKVVTLEAVRTEEDIQRFLKLMYKIMNAIRNELFYPNYTNMMCSERNCGYWQRCRQEF